mgnify:CR=1 FL=1
MPKSFSISLEPVEINGQDSLQHTDTMEEQEQVPPKIWQSQEYQDMDFKETLLILLKIITTKNKRLKSKDKWVK